MRGFKFQSQRLSYAHELLTRHPPPALVHPPDWPPDLGHSGLCDLGACPCFQRWLDPSHVYSAGMVAHLFITRSGRVGRADCNGALASVPALA